MTLLPIVERELRVAARQPVTYRARLALPLTASLFFVLFAFVAAYGMPPHLVGTQLFYMGFGLLFISCLLAGCQLTADTISSEKREGTLGFLFLTDLKGYDIVLGKMASSSLGAIYGALALLPLVSLMFLFGGVSGGAMLRLTLASLNVLFLSLAVGMTASCLCREANKSRGWALLILIGLNSAGPLLGFLWSWWQDFPAAHRGMAYWGPFVVSSPVMTFPAALEMLYTRGAPFFWFVNGIVHGMGWLFLLLAIWLAPRTWQDRAATKREFRWQEWWRKHLYGTSEMMAAYRAKMLDENAVHWLTNRGRWGGAAIWGFVWVMVIIWFLLWLLAGKNWLTIEVSFVFAVLTNSTIRAAVALESSKRFAADRESGALELLLCTSMKIPEILAGQLLSVRRRFFRPLVVITVLELLLFTLVAAIPGNRFDGETWALVAGGVLILWVDYLVLPWVGMWKAMSARNPKNAGTEAAGIILGQAWLFLYMWMGILTFVLNYFFRIRGDMDAIMMVSWFVISLLVDWWWFRHAKARLLADFRTIAMTRYTAYEPLTLWGWIGRGLGKLVAKFRKVSAG